MALGMGTPTLSPGTVTCSTETGLALHKPTSHMPHSPTCSPTFANMLTHMLANQPISHVGKQASDFAPSAMASKTCLGSTGQTADCRNTPYKSTRGQCGTFIE